MALLCRHRRRRRGRPYVTGPGKSFAGGSCCCCCCCGDGRAQVSARADMARVRIIMQLTRAGCQFVARPPASRGPLSQLAPSPPVHCDEPSRLVGQTGALKRCIRCPHSRRHPMRHGSITGPASHVSLPPPLPLSAVVQPLRWMGPRARSLSPSLSGAPSDCAADRPGLISCARAHTHSLTSAATPRASTERDRACQMARLAS